MSQVNLSRAVAAGIAGTIVMTMIGLFVAPMMGIPRMNPADMLASAMGGMAVAGWAGHFMIGIVLAVAYAAVGAKLPGAAPVRGALFAIAPWLMAQVAVMPMMGMPLFLRIDGAGRGSLIGHLMYGAVVGAVYGEATATRRVAHA